MASDNSINPFSQRTDADWKALKQRLPFGTVLTGRVVHQARFGVFIDAGLEFPVLMELPWFDAPGMEFPQGYPPLNSLITGSVAGFLDHNHQVCLINTDKKIDWV